MFDLDQAQTLLDTNKISPETYQMILASNVNASAAGTDQGQPSATGFPTQAGSPTQTGPGDVPKAPGAAGLTTTPSAGDSGATPSMGNAPAMMPTPSTDVSGPGYSLVNQLNGLPSFGNMVKGAADQIVGHGAVDALGSIGSSLLPPSMTTGKMTGGVPDNSTPTTPPPVVPGTPSTNGVIPDNLISGIASYGGIARDRSGIALELKGLNTATAGANAEATAQGKLGAEQFAATQTALKNNIGQSYANEQSRQQASAVISQHLADLDKQSQALANNPIDPNHYWASKSTGQKIASAVALALGGFGASLTHTNNTAYDIISNAISRDIDAQKANYEAQNNSLNQRKSYYQMSADLLQNDTAAKQAALSLALAGQKDYVTSLAQKYAGTIGSAQAQQLIGKLTQGTGVSVQNAIDAELPMQMQNIQLQGKRTEMQAQTNGYFTSPQQYIYTDAGQRMVYFGYDKHGNPVGIPAATNGNADTANGANSAYKNAIGAVDGLRDYRALHKGALADLAGPDKQEGERRAALAQTLVNAALGSTRTTPGAQEALGKFVNYGTPWDLVQNTTDENLLNTRKALEGLRMGAFGGLPMAPATRAQIASQTALRVDSNNNPIGGGQ